MSRAWRKLAGKLRTSPDDMEAFVNASRQATGQMPSIAQVIHARDQGLLQGWASRHNTLGTRFNEAAEAAPGLDMSTGALKVGRTANATEAMDAALPAGGRVRDAEIDIPSDLLSDPVFNRAVPRAMREKVRQAEAGGARLSVGDVDIVRRRLAKMQNAPANLGEDFGEVADELSALAGDQVPAYRQMLSDYRDESDFIRGFEHGKAGKAKSEAEGQVAHSIQQTAFGEAGHKAGTSTRQGQKALRNMAPGVPPDDVYPDIAALGRGSAHMAAGGHGIGIFHTVRAFMDNLPESYQRELAEGMLARDPKTIRATLGKLRKAGMDLKQIRQISTGVSALLGATASEAAAR